ncbi:MAG: type V CRISPR-associated protein Cas12k [Stenomitos rutilans HA7619-LM2]|jgi:hypothetical protein|nr:type V CRISPR-associated protein Cas12k [Stenomitos rutilans HA7619-LM2]
MSSSEKPIPFEKAMQTILALLTIDQDSRQYLWNMCIAYTLLINEIFQRVAQHPKFLEWLNQGKLPIGIVKLICKKLEEDEFTGLPKRVYVSAILLVSHTFKAYFAMQSDLQLKLKGKQRWLEVMETDLELAKNTDITSDLIRVRAAEILTEIEAQRSLSSNQQDRQSEPQEQNNSTSLASNSLMSFLFKKWDIAESSLERRAIAHLLRNDCQVNSEEEDPDKLSLRLERKEIEIQRLEDRLKSRLPKGRDPLGERSQQFLEEAIAFAEHYSYVIQNWFWLKWHQTILSRHPADAERLNYWTLFLIYYRWNNAAEFKAWEQDLSRRAANLQTSFSSLPYPLLFESTDDLYWSWEKEEIKDQTRAQNQSTSKNCKKDLKQKRHRTRKRKRQLEKRICVSFKSKGLKCFRFKLYCDRRQLPVFRQFVTDFETYRALPKEDKFSIGLFALRSAHLLWKEDKQGLERKKHWRLQNLWLKWYCAMLHNSSLEGEIMDSWCRSLIYLEISIRLPWKTHRLHLQCTFDPRLLLAEGTEAVRQEKLTLVRKKLDNLEKSLEISEKQIQSCQNSEAQSIDNLTESEELAEPPSEEEKNQKLINRQKARIRILSTLDRLENSTPTRPSMISYNGNCDIVASVCFSRLNVIGIAVINTRSQTVLAYQNLRTLLTNQRTEVLERRAVKITSRKGRTIVKHSAEHPAKFKARRKIKVQRKARRSVVQLSLEQYRLFNRWQNEQRKNLSGRKEEQKRGLYAESRKESNQAQYLNRLIARRLIQLCQKWQVGSIILPDFGDLRESVECEIQARAKRKFPDDNVKLQKQYAKHLRMAFHRWNHKGLSQAICSCAASMGIPVKTGQQPSQGTLREKALAMAIAV